MSGQPMGDPSTPEEIERALEQVLSMIATAERLSREHQVVNLGNLDRRVAQLCAAIAALPPVVARRFATGLGDLVAGLDRLEAATRDAWETVSATRPDTDAAAAAAEVPSSTRASAAYARALAVSEPTPPPPPPSPGEERRRVDRRLGDRRAGDDRRRSDRRNTGSSEDGTEPD